MDDLISRRAAIDTLNDVFTITGRANAVIVQDYIRRVNNRLHDLPSAQSDIIHCRDCKHWMPYEWMFHKVWRSTNMADYEGYEMGCAYSGMHMGANDFCSRPKRREDG